MDKPVKSVVIDNIKIYNRYDWSIYYNCSPKKKTKYVYVIDRAIQSLI